MNPVIPFLAQILGPFYIVAAILLLFRKKLLHKILDDFKKSPGLSYMSGMFAFIIGIIWIMGVFSWGTFTEAIFTLFGIIAVVKGVFLMLFPKTLWSISYKTYSFSIIGGIVCAVLGIWFLSIGYGII